MVLKDIKKFLRLKISFGSKVILDPSCFLTLEDIRKNLGRGLVKFSCKDATVFLTDLRF